MSALDTSLLNGSIEDPTADQSIEIRPILEAVGAEVLGLDLRLGLSAADFTRIHRAHLEYHVLVFRDQQITPAQQVDFSRRFGPLQIHVLKGFQLAGQPEVLIVSKSMAGARHGVLGQPFGDAPCRRHSGSPAPQVIPHHHRRR